MSTRYVVGEANFPLFEGPNAVLDINRGGGLSGVEVTSGAVVRINSGGSGCSMIVGPGSVIRVCSGGSCNGLDVTSGGTAVVMSGGFVSRCEVREYGTLYVYAGGKVYGLLPSEGAVWISPFGVECITSGKHGVKSCGE